MRSLSLHNVTKITVGQLNYYPAGTVGIDYPWWCQSLIFQGDDGATVEVKIYAHDAAVLAPLGIVWPPPKPELTHNEEGVLVDAETGLDRPDPESIDIGTLEPCDAPTTEREPVGSLAESPY